MIPSGAGDRAARKERYIGDKGHEVKPSLIRKAAIDCSLVLMHRISRRLGGAGLAAIGAASTQACTSERLLLERPAIVALGRSGTRMIC
jgi:hypothetical protein